jgi:hypothetical protein
MRRNGKFDQTKTGVDDGDSFPAADDKARDELVVLAPSADGCTAFRK